MSEQLKRELLSFSDSMIGQTMTDPGDLISLREGSTVAYIEKSGKPRIIDLHAETPNNDLSCHLAVYRDRPDLNALLMANGLYSRACADVKKTVPPLLDDMAQIVGPNCRCAKRFLPGPVMDGIKKRFAVLVAGKGCLCGGQTWDDAYVAAFNMEKNCKAVVEGTYLGGYKKINGLEARLMHFVYQKKYSKQKDTNKTTQPV